MGKLAEYLQNIHVQNTLFSCWVILNDASCITVLPASPGIGIEN